MKGKTSKRRDKSSSIEKTPLEKERDEALEKVKRTAPGGETGKEK